MLKIVVLALTMWLGICLAQADRAAVTGTISDQSHLPMAGAHVSVVDPGTGLRRETQSSSSGVFHIAELPIGEYHLEVSAPGFRTVHTKSFVLKVGETRNLDVPLEIATVGSTVAVQDVADDLTVTTAAVSSLTSSQRLNEDRKS